MTLLSACSQFTDMERMDTFGCICSLDEIEAAGFELDDIIDAASDVVVWATSGRVTGRCSTTVRPCADTCSCGRRADDCHCCRLDAIQLPGPLPEVTSVFIDGVELAPSEYGLLDGHELIRVGVGPRPVSWPGCQSLWRPVTEEGTFAIIYEFGFLPFVAEMAATELACDLAGSLVKRRSKLPAKTVAAIMDGVSVTLDPRLIDPFPWMGKLILAFPAGPRPLVWSPEVADGWVLHTVTT